MDQVGVEAVSQRVGLERTVAGVDRRCSRYWIPVQVPRTVRCSAQADSEFPALEETNCLQFVLFLQVQMVGNNVILVDRLCSVCSYYSRGTYVIYSPCPSLFF